MFSGLVREFGKVRFYANNILCIESNLEPKIGDSIAVNGACLTAIKSDKHSFCVELAANTAKSIAIENLNGLVHIEPALRLQDGLHGHIMQGHIDSIGMISHISKSPSGTTFRINAPQSALELMINKGSVCIDGISLTINSVCSEYFELVIIPHTMSHTLFGRYKVGRRVNIESDVIVRTLHNVVKKYLESRDSINSQNLAQDIYDSIALGY